MSNISRRDFLKTAGVMTLAVAAAGVLAGCEGNAAKPEVPEVTQNTVTVGNYTLSLKDVKQYAVKTYKDGHNDGPTNEVDTEDRYVLAVLSLKAVDESKLDNKDAVNLFKTLIKPVDMEQVTIGASSKNVSEDVAKELLGLKDATVEAVNDDNVVMKSFKISEVKQGHTVNYVVAFKVATEKTFEDKDAFKAPALSFVVNDYKGYVYTKMDATIPAVVDVPAGKALIVK